MEIETTEVLNSVPFDFLTALVASGFGLVSGLVASLISPWVHYFIEKRKSNFEQKAKRLSDVRSLLDSASNLDDIKRSSLWGFIDLHLTDKERKLLTPDEGLTVNRSGFNSCKLTSDDRDKQVISIMVARLEDEWFKKRT